MARITLLVTIFSLLQGCFTVSKPEDYISGLQVSPEFTHESARSRPFLVAGVIQNTQGNAATMDGLRIDRQATQGIQQTLTKLRPDLQVLPPLTNENRNTMHEIMYEFSQNHQMSEEGYELFSEIKSDDDPWLLIGVIEDEETHKERYKETDEEGTKTVFTVERRALVHFFVYDMENRRLVWSGSVNDGIQRENTDWDERREIKTGLDLTVAILTMGGSRGYPDTPQRQEVLAHIASRMVLALPYEIEKKKQ